MYTYRFGILTDFKHHVQSAKQNPKLYFKHLTSNKNNNFDTVDLDFKFKEYIKIENQRSRFVYSVNHFLKGKQWKKRESVYVKGRIKYNGKNYSVKAKLFGKNNDHFRHPYKWSFRVKSKDYIHDFHNGRFNLLQPNTRKFVTDKLCNEVLEKHGILSLDYKPINLTINNKPQDIYFVEDFFSKYLIENSNHRDSYIFTFKEIKHPSLKKLSKQQISDVDKIRDDLINNNSKLLNQQKFNIYFALLFVAQNKHPFLNDNFHLFYNNVNNSVEPIIREVWFEHSLKLKTELELKTKIKNFLKGLISANINFKAFLEDIINDESNFEVFYNDVITVALDINEIRNSKEWKLFKEDIYNRYPQAIYLCKNITINTEAILKIDAKKRSIINKPNEVIYFNEDILLSTDMYLEQKDLVIASGITVDMNGYSIVINSGKILAQSEANKPINIFNTLKNNTSSIIVKNAKDTSRLDNVIFKHLSSHKESYWNLPSAITFYDSNVIIENTLFEKNIEGDDFVNFFRCNYFELNNVTFSNIKADAIDSDFSNGIITNSNFINIGNDAIDGSGSTIDISNCTFVGVEDKVISAGEKSNFTISDSSIKNSEIAFVSKDDSKLTELNNSLENNTLDYCVFNKKDEFLHGKLISDKDVSQSKYLIENRSEVFKNKEKLINLKMVDSVKERLYGKEYGKKSIKK